MQDIDCRDNERYVWELSQLQSGDAFYGSCNQCIKLQSQKDLKSMYVCWKTKVRAQLHPTLQPT